ncbi:MAG: hypothetical protein JO318_18705 [Chloroflexi bacterium]|nr:hypothetical protein [Chloroflexota bacterium]
MMAGRYRPQLDQARRSVADEPRAAEVQVRRSVVDELAAVEAWTVAARAFATASDIFAASRSVRGLLRNTAAVLAAAPGAMCLVSLADHDVLRPYVVAHGDRRAQRELRRLVAEVPYADAFSRSVQRTGGVLRMELGNRAMLRLWLPRAFWSYAEHAHVRGVLAAALAKRGQVRATLLLWREGAQSAYAPADQAYVQALAQRLAQGL